MGRLNLIALTHWITAAAVDHPTRLDAEIVARTGASLRSARHAIRRLRELQWLALEGTAFRPRSPRHRPGLLRQVIRRYELAGLAEDQPWELDYAPYFALSPELNRLVQHAFCELLNNAIDHSGGSHVTISMRQTPSHLQLLVSDNGSGLFKRIAETFAIDNPRLAMLELSKGKLTSQPLRHRGEGLFFTSRLADVFDLHANDAAFRQLAWDDGWQPQRALAQHGTSVYASFALDTPRTLDAVRRAHSLDGRGVALERTQVPLRLLASARVGLESRSQARRAAARLASFRHAEIDFAGLADVGHAFVDELFRVIPLETPALALSATNMAPRVAEMVESVRLSAS